MDHRIIQKKLEMLQGLAVAASEPITGWQARTAEYLAVDSYRFAGDWAAAALPAAFPAGKTVCLRAQTTVPAGIVRADSYLAFDFSDMEGLLSVNGQPYAGIDENHRRTPLPAGERLELALEFIAVPAVYHQPQLAGRTGGFAGASIITVSREIEDLYYAVRFAWETAVVVTEPRRKALLEAAIEAALLAVDLTLPRRRLLAEVARAHAILREKLAAIQPDPEAGSVYAVGHTHIDTAWLWPLRETVRKCGRTFSTACRLMERYPDFHFSCSQPQLYLYTKEHYPDLYRQIRHWVEAGRWETSGAMWVEADCNVSGGEALVRQMLYGIRFFQQEFGTRPRMVWLPDVFGYPSSLPEMMAGCGIKYFYTYKLHWQARNPFPATLFHWRGLDGSEVTATVVNNRWAYNNFPNPDQLLYGWQQYAEKAAYPEVLFPFGYGDGGGGVNEEEMEFLHQAEGQFPGLPAVRTGTAEQYFDAVIAAHPVLPVWDGELYVETHRGTYTTQSEMKRANRQCELLLRDAEILGTLARATGGDSVFDAATLRAEWQALLLHQFHDILPGSSIGMVYTEALAALADVLAQSRQVADVQQAALLPLAADSSRAVCLANTLAWPRGDVATVEFPENAVPAAMQGPDGRTAPTQVIARAQGQATVLFPAQGLPAFGYAVFTATDTPAPVAEVIVTPSRLENRYFRIDVNAEGGITRWYDKTQRREVLAAGEVGNDLLLLQDGPEYEDAWNIHETSFKRRYPFEGDTRLTVAEAGPVRGVLRVRRTHRASTLEQDIMIYAHQPRVDFATRVDWQERQTMLKVAFPVAIRSTRATYEVQFGAYERATHRNTSWDQQKFEVPAHRWVDLSEAGYGVSLLNDSRYGCDVHEHVMRLTLLRSTTFPDPEADRGSHQFTYSLLPHAGDWIEGETVRRALELNTPIRAHLGAVPADVPAARSYVTLSGPSVILETLKPAEDADGSILRLYDPHGARGEVTVTLDFPVTQVLACNLVEENAEEVPLHGHTFRFTIQPFQIRTFRLRG